VTTPRGNTATPPPPRAACRPAHLMVAAKAAAQDG
jgi:hypothetical protein